MRDNVGTLQFHSYSTYRHAMVLIVRAWIGDILLGYRRLFLLVSVKRAIGLLRCVGCVCVSALSAGSYLYIFPLGFFLIPRTQPLFSTLHLPSLAITTTIPRHHLIYLPFFSPLLFLQKHTHLLSYLLFQGDYIFNPQCKGVHVHGHHFCSFASIPLYSGQSPPPISTSFC